MRKLVLLYLCLVITLAGCATVTVKDIKDPKGPSGLRYYMSRPYVAVNEPFIIGAQTYLASGEVSADGNYVLLTKVPEGLKDKVAYAREGDLVKLPYVPQVSVIGGPQGAMDNLRGIASGMGTAADILAKLNQGRIPDILKAIEEIKKIKKSLDEMGTASAAGGKAGEKPGDGKTEETPAENDNKKVEEKTGVLNMKVANDNTAFAITPMKRYFDIVYLPDFDREMIVQAKHGLGNASVLVNMGQSWSLQGLEATVDNSAIQKRIFDLIDLGMSALSAAARAQAGLPPIPAGGPQGDAGNKGAVDRSLFRSGTPVTVKITEVRIVAPGIYPILKPEEYKGLSPEELESKYGDRLYIPVYPFTNVAFNTYQTMVVEAAKSSGDSPLLLQQYINTAPTTTEGSSVEDSGQPMDANADNGKKPNG